MVAKNCVVLYWRCIFVNFPVFDTAQKPIQSPDSFPGEPKILDQSSIFQIQSCKYSRSPMSVGRRKKEEAVIAMVSAIKNVLAVLAVAINLKSKI
ncbi:hypothetical protein Q5692_20455 [Microcoleus sp. C2C3]|uniref:hypothetical protein n=1 Tax=unclassified Microcoleus TaxID=2642155 RepID=UPI002FD10E19